MIGLVFPILQALIYLLRFGNLNGGAPVTDYIFFFVSGALIGLALIAALRRCETARAYRAILIGFVVGIPFALFGMIVGGLIGPLGGVLFSASPGIFFVVVGYLVGRVFFKK